MRALTAIRATGAVWFVPLLFAVGAFVASSDLVPENDYATSDFATGSIELILVGPLTAAFVALRFRRVPRQLLTLRASRPGLLVVLAAWWPLVLGAPLAAAVALVSATRTVPGDASSWLIVLVVFATVLACALLGLATAVALPPVLAVPLLGLGLFGWLALPGSGTDMLLRYLNSGFVGCCSPDRVPASGMVLGSLTVAVVVAVGSASVACSPRSYRRPAAITLAAVCLVVATGAAAGALVVRSGEPMNLLAVQPRTTELVCSSQDAVQACVWPEHRTQLPVALDALARVRAGLSDAGLPAVDAVTEAAPHQRQVTFRAPLDSSPDDITYAIVVGYVQAHSRCSWPSDAAIGYVSFAAGLSRSVVEQREDPSSLRAALTAWQGDPDAGRRWLRERLCLSGASAPSDAGGQD